ncbi:MAG: aminopeptidase, partial [Acutalibacteraceae bacterium]
MRDPRQMQLAKNLIRNSVNLQKGEKVWISMSAHDPAMVTALVEQAYEAGGYPFVVLSDAKIERKLMQGMTEEQAKIMAELDKAKMEKMDAYIAIRNSDNIFESTDVPQETSAMLNRVYSQLVHMETRLPKTKWVVLRYP